MLTTVTPKRFTIEEYHRLGELGFFHPNDRVELIRGEIILMPGKKTPHSVCNRRLYRQLYPLIGSRATLSSQEPIILPSDSEPQPDMAILRNRSDEYLSSHPLPDDVLLLMEISDSTLSYDRTTKLSLYAEDGIAYYWIFNLVGTQLESYSEPYRDSCGKFGYRQTKIVLSNEVTIVPCFPDLSIDLSLVFPPVVEPE
jgi:Uma2 family endonuclease